MSLQMHQNKNNSDEHHIPVLLKETLQYLGPVPGNTYLDVTAGYGGHAEKVLEATNYATSVLVDRDSSAIDVLSQKFDQKSVTIQHQDFLSASQELAQSGHSFDLILADLGVSSVHLNSSDRGFAINQVGPLDMRMDRRQSLTAADIINQSAESELTDIFRRYGEEPHAEKIAQLMVRGRPWGTTSGLAEAIAKSTPHKRGSARKRVHPATRVFQALRIVVNDELGQLETALKLWTGQLLRPGGRLVVISFHSLEDRVVKQTFQELGQETYDATLQLLTKHPLTASPEELVFNPRARSAKLRAAVKIKTKI